MIPDEPRSPRMTTAGSRDVITLQQHRSQRGSAFTSSSNFFRRRERSAGLPQRGVS